MASNIARKRAAKANRRKSVVAEKRKSEFLNDTLAAQVFGRDGKPLYVQGPEDSPAHVRFRLERLAMPSALRS